MAVKIRRPILVGGIGLSFGLWMLDLVQDSVAEIGEWGILGTITIATVIWLFGRKTSPKVEYSSVSLPVDEKAVEQAIAQVETAINQLETEADDLDTVTPLRQQVTHLTPELERAEIQLVVTGGKGFGKTTLRQVLESNWISQQQHSLSLQETPALFVSSDTRVEAEGTAQEIALADTPILTNALRSDLVLFVTAGDLTDTEFQTLKQLRAANLRTILVFNKQDQYLPTERATILEHLRKQVAEILAAEDVVGISASPAPVKVRQHQPDASVKEWLEPQSPALTFLCERLSQILIQEGQQLVWATTIRKAELIKAETKTALNQLKRHRALPVIEQCQWIAAAAAFANPVPALDLLATGAVSVQLVAELGEIYQQKFSLQQAQAAAKTLGSLMLKLGLVELSTQTISSILKSNTFTYVAGGALQGVSAAYLTRLAGLSLIEYFQEQEKSTNTPTEQPFNLERLGQKLQQVFQQNQRQLFLQSFVKQAVGHLMPESPQSKFASSQPLASGDCH
ncbi:MAG: DUF697 domain-containing protein [Symploca sp. SIO2C1]|nr:DUF697 domain-containing protein [Symploca sp. SIO2C1]